MYVYIYVPYGCATVAQLRNRVSGCILGHPVMHPDMTYPNRCAPTSLRARQVSRQVQSDLRSCHMTEFQKYIRPTFPVDGKRNRSAVIHRGFSQGIIGYLKGTPDEDKDCICRLIDDGTPMVQCATCNDWFHTGCVQVPQEFLTNKGLEWNCTKCSY